ncbi:unnamed protein product [Urochloa humidicola]
MASFRDLIAPSSLLLLFLVSGGFAPLRVRPVQAEQPYGRTIGDCLNPYKYNSSGLLGYYCGGGSEPSSCPAFLTFHARGPYSTVASIAALLGANATSLAAANEIAGGGEDALLPEGTTVLVPATCACTATPGGRFYQHDAAAYVVKPGDTLFTVANDTFQGLTTCQALHAQGASATTATFPVVPLRCACPSAAQAAAGARYLVTYLVDWGDDVGSLAARFGVDVEAIAAGNVIPPPNTLFPFTTLLIPVEARPNVSQIQTPPWIPPPVGAPDPPLLPPPTLPKESSNRVGVYIGVAVAVVAAAAIAAGGVFLAVTTSRKIGKGTCWDREDEEQVWEPEGRTSEFRIYEFSQVLEATSNFSEENKLGQGGFGPVFRGRLTDGLEMAVKRLASHSGQGFAEFKNEILLVAKLQYSNLVRLLGCCSQGEERILVYEYLPNKSLDFFIFDETRRALLDWTKRFAIIEGIAQGLLYLHKHSRLRVIHRDLKASNILLDSDMNPKISDFGLARIFGTNDSQGNTRRIAGTFGYMTPEYALGGIFSIKSDVFSFGMIILEIVSGKRTSSFHECEDFINLLGHAWQLWKDGLWLQLVDPSLDAERHAPEMMRCINIALLCVQENASDRPTMSDVIAMLSSETKTLLEPERPAYFHVRVNAAGESTVAVPCSVNDVTVTALDGR